MKILKKNKWISLVKAAVVFITAFIIMGPLFWMIVTSLKPESEIYRVPLKVLPDAMNFENYKYALRETKIPLYFLNSVLYAVLTLTVVLFCVSLASYAISRCR